MVNTSLFTPPPGSLVCLAMDRIDGIDIEPPKT